MRATARWLALACCIAGTLGVLLSVRHGWHAERRFGGVVGVGLLLFVVSFWPRRRQP